MSRLDGPDGSSRSGLEAEHQAFRRVGLVPHSHGETTQHA